MLDLLERHQAVYRGRCVLPPRRLLQAPEFLAVPSSLDQAELAAWTHIARVLLNLHETVTRS